MRVFPGQVEPMRSPSACAHPRASSVALVETFNLCLSKNSRRGRLHPPPAVPRYHGPLLVPPYVSSPPLIDTLRKYSLRSPHLSLGPSKPCSSKPIPSLQPPTTLHTIISHTPHPQGLQEPLPQNPRGRWPRRHRLGHRGAVPVGSRREKVRLHPDRGGQGQAGALHA